MLTMKENRNKWDVTDGRRDVSGGRRVGTEGKMV